MKRYLLLMVVVVLGWSTLPSASAGKKEANDKVAALLKDLQSKDVDMQVTAMVTLGEHGSQAAPAVPHLIKIMHGKNEDLVLNAALALSKIGSPAVEPLTKTLASKDDPARYYAISALGWMGPDAKAATPTVLKFVTDKNDDIRRKAV